MKYISFLFIMVLMSGLANAQETDLSAVEFSAKIASTNDAVIVDVRTPEEFKKGHLENALNLNWNGPEFEEQMAALDKRQPMFVYCLSGGRSASAAAAMREAGFEQVYEMQGGMMQWRAADLPEVYMVDRGEGMALSEYEALLDTDKPVLVDFYANWCAPCKKMEPYLAKIAADMDGKIKVVRINVDENPLLCDALGVSGLPVLKLYKDNEIVWDYAGLATEETIREQLK